MQYINNVKIKDLYLYNKTKKYIVKVNIDVETQLGKQSIIKEL
jgi:hypothetical protein